MFAVIQKYVATPRDMLPRPDQSCQDSLQSQYIVECFLDDFQRSVIHLDNSSVVFAFAGEQPKCLRRTILGSKDGVFCMFQGEMKFLDDLRKRYNSTREENEAIILIRIFKILQEDNSQQIPLFWGLDSKYALVISDDAAIVGKTCALNSKCFPQGHVYISCRGRVGLEAIFMDSTPEEEKHLQQVQSDVNSQAGQHRSIGPHLIWHPPTRPEVFKINTKGLVFTNDTSIGIGVVIRNWRGKILIALSQKIKGFTQSSHAEGLAALEGMRMAHKEGIRHSLLENNDIIARHSGNMKAYSALLMSVGGALAAGFMNIGHLVAQEYANRAAHGLAEYAEDIDDSIVWHKEIPPCISEIVLMESNPQAQPLMTFRDTAMYI